jgi:phosphate transport system ATP-binding protein
MPVVKTPMPPVPTVAPQQHPPETATGPVKIDVQSMNFYYGAKRALEDISLHIYPNVVTAFIGPSGCGKSTFIRTLNRMNDVIPGTRVEGKVLIENADIYASGVDVVKLRRRVGMVFRSRTRSRNRFSRTSPTDCASIAWRHRGPSSPDASRRA